MEFKFSLKDGDKETSFKFAGDPLDVVDGLINRLAKFWDNETDDDNQL